MLPGSPQQTVVAFHHYVVFNSLVALQAEAVKPAQLGLAFGNAVWSLKRLVLAQLKRGHNIIRGIIPSASCWTIVILLPFPVSFQRSHGSVKFRLATGTCQLFCSKLACCGHLHSESANFSKKQVSDNLKPKHLKLASFKPFQSTSMRAYPPGTQRHKGTAMRGPHIFLQ